jgi:hypothetical protein
VDPNPRRATQFRRSRTHRCGSRTAIAARWPRIPAPSTTSRIGRLASGVGRHATSAAYGTVAAHRRDDEAAQLRRRRGAEQEPQRGEEDEEDEVDADHEEHGGRGSDGGTPLRLRK